MSILCIFAALLVAAFGVQPDADAKKLHAVPRLVAEHAELIPGTTAFLGLHFEIEKRWHLYWDGLNDTGFAPEVKLTLPPGFEAKAIQWPAPHRHVAPGDTLDHVYERTLTLIIPITVPADAKPGTKVDISADAKWLVCDQVCIPEERLVTMSMSVGHALDKPKPGSDAKLFAAARPAIAKPWPKDGTITATWNARTLILHAPRATRIEFYAGKDCPPPLNLIEDGEADGDTLRLRFGPVKDAKKPVDGIVGVWRPGAEGESKGSKSEYFKLEIPIPSKD